MKKEVKIEDAEAGKQVRDGRRVSAVTHPALETYIEETAPRRRLTDKKAYVAYAGVLVLANLQAIVAETDWACLGAKCTADDRVGWSQVELLFTVLFIIDIGTRMWDFTVKFYFKGDPSTNTLGFDIPRVLDTLVVFLMFIDVCVLSPVGVYTELKLLSMLRVLHLASFVKSVQLMSAFRELWLIIADISDTLKSVVWVLLLLLLLMWITAIMVTIAAGHNISWKDFDFSRSAWKKDDYWGTTTKSLYSMFQIVTRDHWADSLAGPLVHRYPALMIVFVVFMTITSLALLNTIVGVVVESTLASANQNTEKQDKEREIIDRRVMESLQEIFEDADTDGSGELDRKELAAAMKQKPVRNRLKMLDIPFKDLDLLFTLLDDEGTGNVQTDRFFRSSARLRGPAMSADLYQMSIDLDRSITDATNMIDDTTLVNDMLSDLLDCIDSVDLDIVKGDTDDNDPVLKSRRERPRKGRGDFLRSAANPNYVSKNLASDDSDAFQAREPSKQSRASEGSKGSKSLVLAALRSGPDLSKFGADTPVNSGQLPGQVQAPRRMSADGEEMPIMRQDSKKKAQIDKQGALGFQWPT